MKIIFKLRILQQVNTYGTTKPQWTSWLTEQMQQFRTEPIDRPSDPAIWQLKSHSVRHMKPLSLQSAKALSRQASNSTTSMSGQ